MSNSAIAFDLGQRLLTTKGDVIGYSTAINRLGVGSNEQILIADSSQGLGIKWADPVAAGGSGEGYTTSGLALGDAAYLSSANTVSLADASSGINNEAIGMITAAGVVAYDGFEIAGLSSLTVGSWYYLSNVGTTGNTITTTAPISSGETVQRIGWARSTTVLILAFEKNPVTLA